jgi:hypothetical protein
MQSLTALLVARGFIFSAQKNLLYTGLMGWGAVNSKKRTKITNVLMLIFKNRDK